MAELTPAGYVIKTGSEWFIQERDLYLAIDPNWNLDPSTPDGLKLASDAEIWTNLDEQAYAAYNSKDPNAAGGVELDKLLILTTGRPRNEGTPSNVVLTVTGINGTNIPQGSIAESTENGSTWQTDAVVTIGISGTATVNASAVLVGDTQASVGVITRIKTPIGGWQSVTNLTVATPGTNSETDPEARERRNRSVALPGNNQLDNMISALLSTEGVRRVSIPENDTNVTDANGLPPHSIAPIVDGGTDEDVALSIYLKKNPGVTLHPVNAPVVVPVVSPVTGNSKDITFSRPDYIDVIVEVQIVNDGSLPANAAQLVKDAILDYVGGDLLDPSCGFNQLGFDIGEDVPISRMYTPVNSVIGKYGNSYVQLLELNALAANVAIAFNELARFTEVNIVVSIT
jgi:uncharacterized phage protein gp47/JayE